MYFLPHFEVCYFAIVLNTITSSHLVIAAEDYQTLSRQLVPENIAEQLAHIASKNSQTNKKEEYEYYDQNRKGDEHTYESKREEYADDVSEYERDAHDPIDNDEKFKQSRSKHKVKKVAYHTVQVSLDELVEKVKERLMSDPNMQSKVNTQSIFIRNPEMNTDIQEQNIHKGRVIDNGGHHRVQNDNRKRINKGRARINTQKKRISSEAVYEKKQELPIHSSPNVRVPQLEEEMDELNPDGEMFEKVKLQAKEGKDSYEDYIIPEKEEEIFDYELTKTNYKRITPNKPAKPTIAQKQGISGIFKSDIGRQEFSAESVARIPQVASDRHKINNNRQKQQRVPYNYKSKMRRPPIAAEALSDTPRTVAKRPNIAQQYEGKKEPEVSKTYKTLYFDKQALPGKPVPVAGLRQQKYKIATEYNDNKEAGVSEIFNPNVERPQVSAKLQIATMEATAKRHKVAPAYDDIRQSEKDMSNNHNSNRAQSYQAKTLGKTTKAISTEQTPEYYEDDTQVTKEEEPRAKTVHILNYKDEEKNYKEPPSFSPYSRNKGFVKPILAPIIIQEVSTGTTKKGYKMKLGTMILTRETYKMSSPNYYASLPRIAEKYNFNEPIPERDREEENLRPVGNPPANINGKVKVK